MVCAFQVGFPISSIEICDLLQREGRADERRSPISEAGKKDADQIPA
jgi:hypothetical protein